MRPERSADEIDALIRRETALLAPPLTPELVIHGAADYARLWSATEADLDRMAMPPPFWAFAWAGGQALARLLLDQPELAAGRRVVAIAAGAGLEAIAAAKAGAASVLANDIDAFAQRAMALNAAANGVDIAIDGRDLLSAEAPPAADLILAADAHYEAGLAQRLDRLLRAAVAAGADVLVGDAGRPFGPEGGFETIAVYEVPTPISLEDVAQRRAVVLRATGAATGAVMGAATGAANA